MTTDCTGLTAHWCPKHGDCVCSGWDDPEGGLSDDGCPLHDDQSMHPEAAYWSDCVLVNTSKPLPPIWTSRFELDINQWDIDDHSRIIESNISHAILTRFHYGHAAYKEWWMVTDRADIDLLNRDLPRYAEEVAGRAEKRGAASLGYPGSIKV